MPTVNRTGADAYIHFYHSQLWIAWAASGVEGAMDRRTQPRVAEDFEAIRFELARIRGQQRRVVFPPASAGSKFDKPVAEIDQIIWDGADHIVIWR